MDDLDVSIQEGVHVIRLTGFLDRYLSARMREEVIRLSADNDSIPIVVDMSEITHIDSMGVGMLVSSLNSSRAKQTPFGIIGVVGKAREVLHLTRLDKVLPIYDNLPTAVNSLLYPGPIAPTEAF